MNDKTAAQNNHVLLGGYLLGGLTEAENKSFEEHLQTCSQCQEELSASSFIPSLLKTLDPAEAQLLLAPKTAQKMTQERKVANQEPDGTISLVARLASIRHRRRAAITSIVACGVAASIALGVFMAPMLTPGNKPDVQYSATSAVGTHIQIGMNAKAWGTEVHFSGNQLPTAGLLSLWVIDSSGTAERAGAWQATTTGSAKLTGATPTPLKEIRTLELRDPDSKVLMVLSAPESQPAKT